MAPHRAGGLAVLRAVPKQWRQCSTPLGRLVKRDGVRPVTTNRIAAVAGSISSLYQYFPDKRAIFVAMVAAMIDAYARDPAPVSSISVSPRTRP